jgi:zinc protease
MTFAPRFQPAAWQPEMAMTQYAFDNGLTLIVLPEHRLPVASLQIHYRVGSRHELPGITGISHLFEHMMFRGTDKYGPEEFSRILQARGGEINAFTTKDNTSYFENLPAEHLELGLELEADRLLNLKLDEENFQPELQVVISERKLRSVDSPFGLLEEQLWATAFTQHPYQWPVIGWNQDLQCMTLADCQDYYRRHYHPGKTTIVISGDVAPDAARELVARHFGAIPGPGPVAEAVFVEPPQRGERRAVLKKVSQVEVMFAGFHTVGLGHPDLHPLSLLALILSRGKASRFYQEFVRPGKAVSVDVDITSIPFTSQDPDLMLVAAVAAPGYPMATLEGEIWAAIARLQEDGVTEAELARAKKIVRSRAVRSLSHNFFRGLLAGLFHVKTGDAAGANNILAAVEQVTAADLLRAARQYLRPDNRTVALLQPVTPEESEALGPLA